MNTDRLPLPPLPLLDGTTLQISDSTLSQMKACPQMAAFKLLWKRQRGGNVMSLDAGKAIHSALQARSETREAVFTPALLSDAKAAITAAYTGIVVPDDDYRTESRLHAVMDAYREAWPSDPWTVLATELPFAVPLGCICIVSPKRISSDAHTYHDYDQSYVHVIYRGLIDLLVEWDGQTFVVDRKTSAEWSEMTLTQYRMSAQFRGYAWVVQELHRLGLVRELPPVVHGAAVDAIVIRKPSTSTRVTKSREEFHRRRFFYGQDTIAEWRVNTLGIIKSWLQQYADGRFTMNEKTCANHYGRTCQYLPVCELPVAQRLTMLHTDEYVDIMPGPLDQPATEVTP